MSLSGLPPTPCPGAPPVALFPVVAEQRLSSGRAPYYADDIVRHMDLPVDHPVIDRHLWIEVAEYLVAVVGVILIAWLLAEDLASPLWGGLTSIRLR